MSRFSYTCAIAAIFLLPTLLHADECFLTSLERSGYIHDPLPLEVDKSLEMRAAGKKIEADLAVCSFGDMTKWTHEGIGRLSTLPDGPGVNIAFEHPDGVRAKGSPDDPDYAVYGHSIATFALDDLDAGNYNRIAVDIIPHCPGDRVVNINLLMINNPGSPKSRQFNSPTGYHLIHLDNNKPNRCYLEIADLQRDKVAELKFSVSLNGRDLTTGERASYTIANLHFQRVSDPDIVSGWQPAANEIIYSMTG